MKDLLYNGLLVYQFQYCIQKYIKIDDSFIVLLDVPKNKVLNENVICVSIEKGVKWTVPEVNRIYKNSPYINITLELEGVKLFNWDGTNIIVKPETGVILSTNKDLSRPW